MLVTLSGRVIDVSPVQPEKAKEPILEPPVITTVLSDEGTEDEDAPKISSKCVLLVPSTVVPTKGKVIEVSPVQPEKASMPMLVTLSGMVIDVSPVQPRKAYEPILSSALFSPKVMLVRLAQPEKA